MRLLLDTHVFLWYITADPKLPAAFRAASQEVEWVAVERRQSSQV